MTAKVTVPERHWDAMFAPSSVLTMITTVDVEGRVNAATYGTTTRVSHDPMYILFACTAEPADDNYANAVATGAFVINPVPFEDDLLRKARIVGLPFAPGVDELERAGLTAIPSLVVTAPRIRECRSHFECEVAWIQAFEYRAIICGRVVAVSIDEDCYDPRGVVRFERLKPAHFCGAPYGGNFVPAYEPRFVARRYEGPGEWRDGQALPPDSVDILTDLRETVEFGGEGRRP